MKKLDPYKRAPHEAALCKNFSTKVFEVTANGAGTLGEENCHDCNQFIAKILKKEGVWISCFPSNPLIEAVAQEGIRPIAFRHERGAVMAASNERPKKIRDSRRSVPGGCRKCARRGSPGLC